MSDPPMPDPAINKSTTVNIGLVVVVVVSVLGSVFWVQDIVKEQAIESQARFTAALAAFEEQNDAQQKNIDLRLAEAYDRITNAERSVQKANDQVLASILDNHTQSMARLSESFQAQMNLMQKNADERAADRLSLSRADFVAMREAIENSGIGLRKVMPSTGEVVVAEKKDQGR